MSLARRPSKSLTEEYTMTVNELYEYLKDLVEDGQGCYKYQVVMYDAESDTCIPIRVTNDAENEQLIIEHIVGGRQ